MKKVLVTGADGFIGSHLTEELIFEGCEVRALSVYNSFNDWGWLEDVHRPGLTVINGDVRDPAFCMEAVRGCDTVFHLVHYLLQLCSLTSRHQQRHANYMVSRKPCRLACVCFQSRYCFCSQPTPANAQLLRRRREQRRSAECADAYHPCASYPVSAKCQRTL